jgi:hypothetical protein
MQAWLAAAGWRWPAEEQEGLLQGQGPAAAWAEREAAGCALLHLQLGFPLDLYAPCEYLPMYWYCNYLLECQYRLGRMLHGSAPQPQPQPQPRSRGGRGGSLGKSRGHSGGGGVGAGGQMSASEQVVAAREVEVRQLRLSCLPAFCLPAFPPACLPKPGWLPISCLPVCLLSYLPACLTLAGCLFPACLSACFPVCLSAGVLVISWWSSAYIGPACLLPPTYTCPSAPVHIKCKQPLIACLGNRTLLLPAAARPQLAHLILSVFLLVLLCSSESVL